MKRFCLFLPLVAALVTVECQAAEQFARHAYDAPVYVSVHPEFRVSEPVRGTREVKILVLRTGEYRVPARVSYVIEPGSATVGEDFSGETTGRLTFPAGQSLAEIPILIHSDTAVEKDEIIRIRLQEPSENVFLLSPNSILIVHDSTSPNPKVPPHLSLRTDAEGRMVLSWPAWAEDSIVEKARNAADAQWEPLPGTPEQVENRLVMVDDCTGSRGFYRLRIPSP